MDYEKEYKKLKVDIEKAYLFAQTDSTKAVLEHILPELAESESVDERIRKRLIDFFENWGETKSHCWSIPVTDIIDWLEKQELKSNPYSGVSFEYNGHTWGMCARDGGVDILFNKKLIQHISSEKQCEQKPIDYNEELKKCRENPLYFFDKYVKIEEQKPDWSEDYTERMGQIINYLKCQAKEEPTRRRTLLGWVALLKSIFRKGLPEIQIPGTEAARKGIHRIMDVLDWAADKGRISDSDCEDYIILLSAYLPQSKPTWSKEDETRLTHTLRVLHVEDKKTYLLMYGLNNLQDLEKDVKWLKSLKQRHKWKPSEKQIEALEDEYQNTESEIRDTIEDYKKNMEE